MKNAELILLNNAAWVTAPSEFDCPVICREFVCDNFDKADIAISALGFFMLYINGKRVGKDYFLPNNSLFRERDTNAFLYPINDKFTYRCYYTVYDITDYLTEGVNRIEIHLGNGWYRQNLRVAEGNVAFGDSLGAIYAISLEKADNCTAFYSDGSEKSRTAALVKSDLFKGEVYDGTLTEFKSGGVEILKLEDTALSPEIAPPDRIIRQLEPRLIYTDGNRRLYDAGETVSGFVSFETSAPYGETVTIRFADEIKNNQLDFIGTDENQPMQDSVIGNGRKIVFEPRFVWHAFRYFETVGDIKPLSVKVVHSDVTVTSNFECDLPELNWLYSSYIRGQLDNMHCGTPLDCPHRERLGYTGDGQACAPAAMIMLDGRSFYKKWIRDIFDSQCKVTGHSNHTAPFAGGGGGPGGWGMAAITVPYNYYKIYGDITPAKENYDGIKKWIEYLVDRSENGIVVREEEGGWCLGDWMTPEKTELDVPFANTCMFIRALGFAKVIAEKLGHKDDALHFEAIAENAKKAVTDIYYDTESGDFAGGRQGANVFAAVAGLGDESTVKKIAKFYGAMGRFDTGFLATELVTELLFENGFQDIAVKMLSSHEIGGFGYMMDNGATTIWEAWQHCASLNHPMFGACTRMLFSGILGITQAESSVNYGDIVIAPKLPKQLNYAKGHITLDTGKLSVEWQKSESSVKLNITIPKGKTAVLVYGGKSTALDCGENEIYI